MNLTDIEYTPELSILGVKDMWTTQFIGRKLTDNNQVNFYNRLELDSEKYYIFLDIEKDDKNIIRSIIPRKILDNSPAHGKPVTKSVKFSNADIKAAVKSLSENTVARVTKEMLEKLISDYSLANSSCKLKLTKTSLSFVNDEINISIPINKIIEYWEISYSYLDIVDNPDFWNANEYLDCDHMKPMCELFKMIKISNYVDYESLLKKSERNKYLTEAIPKYRILCESIAKGNTSLIKTLIGYSSLDYFEENLNAFELAVEQKNIKLIKELINVKAYVNNSGLLKAADILPDELILTILNQKGDLSGNNTIADALAKSQKYDLMVETIRRGAYYYTCGLPLEYLIAISNFDNVDFSESSIWKLFDAGEYTILKRIIERNVNNHHEKAFSTLCSVYNSANFALIKKALFAKDIELGKKITDIFYDPMSEEFAIFLVKKAENNPVDRRRMIAQILNYATDNNYLYIDNLSNDGQKKLLEFFKKYLDT